MTIKSWSGRNIHKKAMLTEYDDYGGAVLLHNIKIDQNTKVHVLKKNW